MRRLVQHVAADEDGGVLIFVAGFLPLAVIVAAFVIDVGNGMEHHRHLQVQADAGALAAAPEFARCRNDPTGANAEIVKRAKQYAGQPGTGGTPYNQQVGGPDAQTRVKVAVNATGYGGADESDGDPCTTGFVDVKLVEESSPAFFGFVGNHDYHGHARVQVFRVQQLSGLRPIAVPDPAPKVGKVILVNERDPSDPNDGLPLEKPLHQDGTDGGLAIWDNKGDPLSLQVKSQLDHIGVRVVFGGASSTSCGDPLVDCYDAGDLTKGVLHIQGWTAEGTVRQNIGGTGVQDKPLARSVELTKPGAADACNGAYFSYFSSACTIGVRATVDFGGDPQTVGAKLVARVLGADYDMSYDSVTGRWNTGQRISIPPHSGPADVELKWEETKGKIDKNVCSTSGGNKCKDTFGVLQRHFSGNSARSGPIQRAEVSEGDVTPVNSLERCSSVQTSCTHDLVVKIAVGGGIALAPPDSPDPQYLRVADGSQTQLLDCDPSLSPVDQLSKGCGPSYTVNGGSTCPHWSEVQKTAQPWQCVGITTGKSASEIAKGLNTRILGSEKPTTCTAPNHWPDYAPTDPRIVLLMVTPFGSFDGEGKDASVPVTNFASFYITGWNPGNGSGFDNPCQTEGDEIPRDSGEIVGRFISYVTLPNDFPPSDQTCDLLSNDITPCTAVLVQ